MKKESKRKIHTYLPSIVTFIIFFLGLSGGNIAHSQGTSSSPLDSLEPSDIENVIVQAGDGEVQLTWTGATDNVDVIGYKIYRGTRSVKTSEDRYDLPTIPVGNVKTYTVKNLTNGQTYYFTVTAVDAAGNESLNYGPEVTASPKSGLRLIPTEDDGKSPQIKEVKGEDIIGVKVVFSELVKLPEESPASAFRIEKIKDKSRLVVQKAEIDTRDPTGKTVLLTTAPQQEETEYLLTAGIEIRDSMNNPIISGTSDTGSFKSNVQKKLVANTNPTQPPPDPSMILKDVTVPEIGLKVPETQALTEPMRSSSLEGVVPPADVTDLLARLKDDASDIVELGWKPSKSASRDLVDQLLYQSQDKNGKKFGNATSLGSTTTAVKVEDLEPGNWYTFKITTKNFAGIESTGASTSIFLPETGPIELTTGLTALLMGIYWRKKRKKLS